MDQELLHTKQPIMSPVRYKRRTWYFPEIPFGSNNSNIIGSDFKGRIPGIIFGYSRETRNLFVFKWVYPVILLISDTNICIFRFHYSHRQPHRNNFSF